MTRHPGKDRRPISFEDFKTDSEWQRITLSDAPNLQSIGILVARFEFLHDFVRMLIDKLLNVPLGLHAFKVTDGLLFGKTVDLLQRLGQKDDQDFEQLIVNLKACGVFRNSVVHAMYTQGPPIVRTKRNRGSLQWKDYVHDEAEVLEWVNFMIFNQRLLEYMAFTEYYDIREEHPE